MSLTRRDFLRYIGSALGYVALRSVFPEEVYSKNNDRLISDEYIPEIGMIWDKYMCKVYHFTSGVKGYKYPKLLTEENFNKAMDFVLSDKNYYRDFIKREWFGIKYFLVPYYSPYLHPEVEKELYRYFRRAVSEIVGKDILKCKMEPEDNMLKYVVRGEKAPWDVCEKNIKIGLEKFDYRYWREMYDRYIRSPPVAIVLCKTLVRKQILEEPEIYLDQVAEIDEKRKILRFWSKEDWKHEGALTEYYWLKPKYRKLMGRVIKLDSLDDAVKYLYQAISRDAVLIFGGKKGRAFCPIFDFGRIDNLLKRKKTYEIYFNYNDALDLALERKVPNQELKIY